MCIRDRGTFDDVILIEQLFWNKNAVGIMTKKYDGMEMEAVRDWKMHICRFITIRLRLLRQAGSFLTEATTPKELGTAMSFSYDQRLKEPKKTLCPAYYGKEDAEWRTMWTGGPLEALFFTIATGNFRTPNDFKNESYRTGKLVPTLCQRDLLPRCL